MEATNSDKSDHGDQGSVPTLASLSELQSSRPKSWQSDGGGRLIKGAELRD